MLVELEMQHSNSLKSLLQYNLIFIILFLFLILYILIFTNIIKYKSVYNGDEQKIEGKIISFSLNGNKLKLNVLAKEKIIATYYIDTREEKEKILNEINIGDQIILYGELQKPSNNTIPNNFNYKKYLKNNKIYYLINVESFVVKSSNCFRNKIKDFLYKRAYNLKNSDYLLALVLGDKSLLSNDEYNVYQNNGTAHLLAISGSHIAVLIFIFSKILQKLHEVKKLIILSIILLFFSFLTGFQASINRAILFFILNSINKILKLHFNNLQILFFTAFIMILLNPFIIYNIGFIYSFVTCGGIIYFQDRINGNYINKLFKVSFIAFIFSLPISIYINYEINIMSILFNMVFVPLVSLIIFPMAILTYIFSFFNPIFSLMLQFVNFLNTIFVNLSLIIYIPKTSIFIIAFLYIILLLIRKNLVFIIIFLSILIFIKIIPYLGNDYRIYFFDVGQGDSALIIFPHNNKTILIDTGGVVNYKQEEWEKSTKNYNLSDNIIKFFKSIGIRKIDYLIISHGDYDHIGESINIVNNFKIKNVIFNKGSYNNLELELINILNNKKIPYFQDINTINIKNGNIFFLNKELYDDENDNSIVLYSKINNFKLLFMGDASATVENDILNKFNLKNIDILKVGHHGSNTSSSKNFINKLNPRYAIISVGKNNRYGHPMKEVLNQLSNSIVYRTDINGTIMFRISKQSVMIEQWNS